MANKLNTLFVLLLVFSLSLPSNSSSVRNKILKNALFSAERSSAGQKREEPGFPKNPSFMVVGYNFLIGNPKMTPSSGKLLDPGFATDIFELTYNKNQVSGDKLTSYPDGFALQSTQVCQANFSAQTIRTKTELQSSIEASLGVEGEYLGFSASLNVDYKQMCKSMSEYDKMYMMNEAECSIYKTHVKQYDPPKLSVDFMNGLKEIDGLSWNSRKKEFRKFIDSFGTHYIKETLMGSRYTYILETSNSKYNSMVEKGFNMSAEASYSAIVSLSVKATLNKASSNYGEFEKNMSNK